MPGIRKEVFKMELFETIRTRRSVRKPHVFQQLLGNLIVDRNIGLLSKISHSPAIISNCDQSVLPISFPIQKNYRIQPTIKKKNNRFLSSLVGTGDIESP
jgi:hypothetical protein